MRQTEKAERDRYTNTQKSGGARCVANTNTKPGRWRETRRKGVPCLISPDGRIYYGTAQEVRDAALTPRSRKMLADALRWVKWESGVLGKRTPEDRRAWYAAKRREWIRFGAFDFRSPCALNVSARDYLLLNAGMRLVGYDSFKEFVAELVRSEIEGLRDVAHIKTGSFDIPLTRHERAALERMDAAAERARSGEAGGAGA